MKNTKRKTAVNPMIMLSAILFCLVLISTSMTSGLYARYTARGTGSDSARVIKFNNIEVIETGDFTSDGEGNNIFAVVPGINLNKTVTISFGGSEAATYVFVVAETPGWTRDDNGTFKDASGLMSWKVNTNAWTYLPTNDGKYVYYKELAPNTSYTNNFILNNTITVSKANDYLSIFKDYPETKIIVTAYAVQANGFDDVKEAWASLKLK